MNTIGRQQVGECTRYGYGSIRVQRIRVLPVQAHRRSSGLNLRVSTGGRNVHRGTGSTSTEVLVPLGSGVTYMIGAVLRRGLQLRRSSTASRKLYPPRLHLGGPPWTAHSVGWPLLLLHPPGWRARPSPSWRRDLFYSVPNRLYS